MSLPFKKTTKSSLKSFAFGVASGAVEPFAALIGYFLSSFLINSHPWFLSFAAGAMIYVVVEDLIPDMQLEKNSCIGTCGFILGFVVMMALDVALG